MLTIILISMKMILNPNNMKVVDEINPDRIGRKPDKIAILLSDGNLLEHGFTIKKVELRLYVEKYDEKLGPYSLITCLVETERGSIESVYDEGFRGKNSLDRAVKLLQENLGLSGLVLRSIIGLRAELEKQNT